MSEEKKNKRAALLEQGLDIYPYKFKRDITATQISNGEVEESKEYHIAGRLMLMRSMGQAAFFNLQDATGSCQCYVKIKELPSKDQEFFKYVDIGDIIGIKGSFFKTKKGENTLRVSLFKILCKTTEMLPEKYHGLESKELRYRFRHLDLIMNKEVFKILTTRSKVIRLIRSYLDKKGFIEVETPILQPIYGGAMATPFETHHRALDSKFYLKISPELYLKRLIAGGMDKVFEIGKNFRNEGMDRMHNPEFTMLEYYETYTDYEDQMESFEDMVVHIIESIHGKTKIEYQDKVLDFSKPWKRISITEAVESHTSLDLSSISESDLKKALKSKSVPLEGLSSKGEMIMAAFEFFVEREIWNPCFVIDFPKEVSPLTKDHRKKQGLVERFEPYIAGMEIGNAYTELNDPVEQRKRLEDQERSSSEESHPMDEDFLHAVGVGMPPLAGVGLGVDRLVMLLTNQTSIREVIWFPTLKLKNDNE